MKLRFALIKLYSNLFGARSKLVSDRTFISTLYKLSFGRTPGLKSPKTFNEQICRIKLSDESLSYSDYTDKFAVRSYVSKTIGEEYLTPVFGVYDRFEDIPFTEFPQQFVLKATHASGYNIIVKDKSSFCLKKAEKKFANWLKKNYYLVGREKNYRNIKPRILVEQYLNFPQPLTEYKLFCFGGKVRMIAVHRFGAHSHTVTVYSPEWNRLDVRLGYPAEASIEKPDALETIISCAQRLSAAFPFVRVDLYANGNDVRFSELTFTPGGGLVHIDPPSFDETMGTWFET